MISLSGILRPPGPGKPLWNSPMTVHGSISGKSRRQFYIFLRFVLLYVGHFTRIIFQMNNCVRACDTKERILTITLRRTCDDAPISRPISDGESLRNFDENLHKKIQKELDKVLEQKTLPYVR